MTSVDLATMLATVFDPEEAARLAYDHARSLVGVRNKVLEPFIAKSGGFSFWYARDVIRGPFPEGEAAIAATGIYAAYYAGMLSCTFPAGEAAIATDAKASYHYAVCALKGRFHAGEPAIAESRVHSLAYARHIVQGRFEAGEPAIAQSAEASFNYASVVLHGPFPAGEAAIAGTKWESRYTDEVLLARPEI